MNTNIDFATHADLPAMADLLLEDVIVSKAWRGGGLGRKLVEHVFDWARSQGMARVTLLADQSNGPALAFYERLGFEKSAMAVRRKQL